MDAPVTAATIALAAALGVAGCLSSHVSGSAGPAEVAPEASGEVIDTAEPAPEIPADIPADLPAADDAPAVSDDGGAGPDLPEAVPDAAPDPGADVEAADAVDAELPMADSSDATETVEGRPCTTDEDCGDATPVCDTLAGVCVRCLFDLHCGPSEHCLARECVGYAACAENADCAQVADVPLCDPGLGECVACIESADCAGSADCTDGACTPWVACGDSLDCGLDQVCDPEGGRCVACVEEADCAEGEVCVDHACVAHNPCGSDKDCTPLGMLCDKALGECRGCLDNSQCPAAFHCAAGACVVDVCAPEEARCEGNAVAVCNAAGDGFAAPTTCGADQSCVEADHAAHCQDQVCTPGGACSGTVAVACSEDGLVVEGTQDCAELGQECFEGVCVEDRCGDGALDPPAEQCDDENEASCDGCEGCVRLRHARFDGKLGHRVEVPDAAGAPLALVGTPLTVEAWIRLDQVGDTLTIGRHVDNDGWQLRATGNSLVATIFYWGSHDAAASLAGTGWHHVAWTFDGEVSGLWLDGAPLGTKAMPATVRAAARPTVIGATYGGTGELTQFDAGRADELRISDAVRYDAPFLPARRHEADESTLLLLHLDEESGEAVADASGYAHQATAPGVSFEPDDCYGATCGDGARAALEACDDGNAEGGDGCSAACEREPLPYACSGDVLEGAVIFDHFDGDVLDDAWTSGCAGGPLTSSIADSLLVIDDAPAAETPSAPGSSWIFDMDTDLANQVCRPFPAGSGAFDVEVGLSWESGDDQYTLAGVALTTESNVLVAILAASDAHQGGGGLPHLRVSGSGLPGGASPDDDQRWSGPLQTTSGAAVLHLQRRGTEVRGTVDGTLVFEAALSELTVDRLAIFAVAFSMDGTTWEFGRVSVDYVWACR